MTAAITNEMCVWSYISVIEYTSVFRLHGNYFSVLYKLTEISVYCTKADIRNSSSYSVVNFRCVEVRPLGSEKA